MPITSSYFVLKRAQESSTESKWVAQCQESSRVFKGLRSFRFWNPRFQHLSRSMIWILGSRVSCLLGQRCLSISRVPCNWLGSDLRYEGRRGRSHLPPSHGCAVSSESSGQAGHAFIERMIVSASPRPFLPSWLYILSDFDFLNENLDS